jgi:hypothetical protein
MSLNDFFRGTTKKFEVSITFNEAIPDISSDNVTFYLKDNKTDSNYTLTASADVTSSGSVGVAKFNLTDEQTDINAENYYYSIVWDLSNGDKYVLDSNTVKIIDII